MITIQEIFYLKMNLQTCVYVLAVCEKCELRKEKTWEKSRTQCSRAVCSYSRHPWQGDLLPIYELDVKLAGSSNPSQWAVVFFVASTRIDHTFYLRL